MGGHGTASCCTLGNNIPPPVCHVPELDRLAPASPCLAGPGRALPAGPLHPFSASLPAIFPPAPSGPPGVDPKMMLQNLNSVVGVGGGTYRGGIMNRIKDDNENMRRFISEMRGNHEASKNQFLNLTS